MGLRRDYGENPKIDSKRDADSGLGIEQRVEIVETKGSIGFINEAGFLEWVNHTGGKDYVDALNFIKSQGGVKPFDRNLNLEVHPNLITIQKEYSNIFVWIILGLKDILYFFMMVLVNIFIKILRMRTILKNLPNLIILK